MTTKKDNNGNFSNLVHKHSSKSRDYASKKQTYVAMHQLSLSINAAVVCLASTIHLPGDDLERCPRAGVGLS